MVSGGVRPLVLVGLWRVPPKKLAFVFVCLEVRWGKQWGVNGFCLNKAPKLQCDTFSMHHLQTCFFVYGFGCHARIITRRSVGLSCIPSAKRCTRGPSEGPRPEIGAAGSRDRESESAFNLSLPDCLDFIRFGKTILETESSDFFWPICSGSNCWSEGCDPKGPVKTCWKQIQPIDFHKTNKRCIDPLLRREEQPRKD